MQETIGKRIARLRQELCWTQQSLAERLAISRVAVSHIEMDLTIPGERTITLLAGIFKMTPLRLVEETTYPIEKAERLPQTACCYTALELELRLLEKDIEWMGRLEDCKNNAQENRALAARVTAYWRNQLEIWSSEVLSETEKEQLAHARRLLRRLQAPTPSPHQPGDSSVI